MKYTVPIVTMHNRLTFLALRQQVRQHELASQRSIATRLARLLGCSYQELQALPRVLRDGAVGYAVPNDTITSIADASNLGIHSEHDLFGGVVPHPFVAGKTITHPLIAANAAAPSGWQPQFAEQVRHVVLPGLSAFSVSDLHAAATQLLRDGEVRIKLASGIGGSGQSVARDETQLRAQLAILDPVEIERNGAVVERNLAVVRTDSVGELRVGNLVASYVGSQCLTQSRRGHPVYGGSSIKVVRGGLDELHRLTCEPSARRSIEQARVYHGAALANFDGMILSRCNYDVAQGRDRSGRPYGGVLEQSWRMGGASAAEVAALEALCSDPTATVVHAATVEVHGPDAAVPEGATVSFSGFDDELGPITKYSYLIRDEAVRTEN